MPLQWTRAGLERAGTTVLGVICADARDLPKLLPGNVDIYRGGRSRPSTCGPNPFLGDAAVPIRFSDELRFRVFLDVSSSRSNTFRAAVTLKGDVQ